MFFKKLASLPMRPRSLFVLLLFLVTECLVTGCSSHRIPNAETPVPTILTGNMNHQHDPTKTQRFMERVGEQTSDIAEQTFADGLEHINTLCAKEQNTESAYIRAWQALRYFDLELSAGLYLRAHTVFTVLATLETNSWASVRGQAAGILRRVTGFEPDEPPPNHFREADLAGGPRPGSLKNLNEAVRWHPGGLITPVRQTCLENNYYQKLAKTYRLILVNKAKGRPPLPPQWETK